MKEVVFLYGRNGTVQEFASKDVAYKELGFNFIAYTVAVHIGDVADNYTFKGVDMHPKNEELGRMNPYTTQKKLGDFVLRNEYGDILTIVDFENHDSAKKRILATIAILSLEVGMGSVQFLGLVVESVIVVG